MEMNEVKPAQNINENPQRLLGISPLKKELPPLVPKLQGHAHE